MFVHFIGGACLIHTVSGDLLRSLDPPEPCQSPRLATIAAEEGVILVTFDKGHICSFTINGKFLKHTEIQGKVNVSGNFFFNDLESYDVIFFHFHLSTLYST